MKRLLMAIAVLAVTVLPSFAADATAPDMQRTAPDMKGAAPDMKGTMRPGMRHHGMKKEMMHNPHHLLVMAYHKNVLTFGHMLEKVAKHGETVPRDFARTAIAEMRRSTEEMEKNRAEAMRNMPADMKDQGDMKKMMDQHLVNVKTHLRQLEDLARNDRIPSREVITHLQAIFEGCEGVAEGKGCGEMDGNGRHGGMMHHDNHDGMMHGKGMQGCPCDCQGEGAKCEDMDEDEE